MDARPFPQNEAAEKAAVCLAFHSREWVGRLTARGFRPEWLQSPASRSLWVETAAEWENASDAILEISPAILAARLMAEKKIELVGGVQNILDVHGYTPPIAHDDMADHIADMLRDAWQRREAIALANKLSNEAYASDESFAVSIESAVSKLGNLTAVNAAGRMRNGNDVLLEWISDLQSVIDNKDGRTPETGVPTGIAEVDEKIGGLIPDFWMIGAPTSGGKTVLAIQLVRAVMRAGRRALVFALEMSSKQVVRRIVAGEAQVPMSRLIQPLTLNDHDITKITLAGVDGKFGKLTLCDDADVTIQEIRSLARSEHARDPLGCVLVDYLQLASAGRFRDGANREQEVSFIGAQCKKMAKELGVPVIAPTQLNDDGRVRESRALKQHAAVYLVIEEDEKDQSGRVTKPAKILCPKNRDGERDWTAPFRLVGEYQEFQRHNDREQ